MAEFILGNFKDLYDCWTGLHKRSTARLLFSSPDWSELWWQHFGTGSELHLGAVLHEGHCIGIAPLRLKEGTAYFIGSDDVCDFLDFIIEPGMEAVFFETLLSDLIGNSIHTLNLSPLLPESSARCYFLDKQKERVFQTYCSQIDVTVMLDLPSDLNTYLLMLSGKQRHELLRKERRLNEEGEVAYKISETVSEQDLDMFMQFFRESREDKRRFLTSQMESFFRVVIGQTSVSKILRFGKLELDKKIVAATIGFDYQDCSYLYNSGYNPDYRWLSVGLLSKYYFIKYSIENHKYKFDFLKGNERYKYNLGGKEIPIYRCIIKTIDY